MMDTDFKMLIPIITAVCQEKRINEEFYCIFDVVDYLLTLVLACVSAAPRSNNKVPKILAT